MVLHAEDQPAGDARRNGIHRGSTQTVPRKLRLPRARAQARVGHIWHLRWRDHYAGREDGLAQVDNRCPAEKRKRCIFMSVAATLQNTTRTGRCRRRIV